MCLMENEQLQTPEQNKNVENELNVKLKSTSWK